MKETMKKVWDIASWVLLIVMCLLMLLSIKNAVTARQTGESAFIFGYRPVLVLTGSMEPYMMTNGLALTREVDSISDLEVGDVVTYHIESDSGKLLRITHRIIDLDGDKIYTKGDNNNVADGFALTMDNIEAEVVGVWNGTAWIAQKWQTTAGKVMLICIPVFLILLNWTIKLFRKAKEDETETAR